jgi:hypothetical protein
VSRLQYLKARRRVLLRECEAQRSELSERIGELKASPLSRAAGELLSRGGDGLPLLKPLTWAAALAGVLLLRRPRQVLTLLGWARTAVGLGSRAAMVLKVIDQLRARRRERGSAEP